MKERKGVVVPTAEPNLADAVFGPGGKFNAIRRDGLYRYLIKSNVEPYYELKEHSEKCAYVKERIIDVISRSGGRFLEQNEDGELIEVTDQTKIFRKVSQALRDLKKKKKSQVRMSEGVHAGPYSPLIVFQTGQASR